MSSPSPGVQTPRFGAIAGLALVAAILIAAVVIKAIPRSDDAGIYGWNTGPDGETVTSISPGLPADRAGLRVGDRVEYAVLPLLGRINTDWPQAVAPGDTLTVRFERNGVSHIVTMAAAPTVGINVRMIAGLIAGFVVMLVGGFLVIARPTRMSWGLLLVGLTELADPLINRWSTPMVLLLTATLSNVVRAAGWAGLLIFASRFPTNMPHGWLRGVDKAAVPIASIYVALSVVDALIFRYGAAPPPYAVQLALLYVIPASISLLAFASLANALFGARGSTRQRLIPVTSTFAVYALIAGGGIIANVIATNIIVLTALPVAGAVMLVAFAAAAAYGIVRHRVFDVTFIVSRTVVYTLLTAILIGIFAVVDILVARWLEGSQLAIVVELAVAVTIGVSLRTMHHRVDRFVDSVLFRHRHVAEQRLARVAKTLPHATSAEFVDAALVDEPVDSYSLASAAVFRRETGGSFARVASNGWGQRDAPALDASDRLVVQLAAELDVVHLGSIRWPRTDLPSGLAQPLLAIPIVVRHSLTAIAIYGGHVGGEAIDPDEVRALVQLAAPAAAAYDHIEAASLQGQLEELRTANAALQVENRATSGAVEIMRRQMTAIDVLIGERRMDPIQGSIQGSTPT